jgi:hypothetical protein
MDLQELRQVHNDSFIPYHPGAAPVPAEAWERRFSHPTFRPDLSFLMLDSDTGEISGYILSAHVTERTGHTDNPSGALQVYERAGFTVTHSTTTYSRKIY